MTGGLTGLLDKIKLHFEGVVSYVTGAMTVYPKVVMSFLITFVQCVTCIHEKSFHFIIGISPFCVYLLNTSYLHTLNKWLVVFSCLATVTIYLF